MSHETTKRKLSGSEAVAGLIMAIFIGLPPYIYFTDGYFPFVEEREIFYMTIVSGFAGGICGLLFAKASKFLGLIFGVIASLGATLFFYYYAFLPPVKVSMYKIEILAVLFVGALPGIMAYGIGIAFWVKPTARYK